MSTAPLERQLRQTVGNAIRQALTDD